MAHNGMQYMYLIPKRTMNNVCKCLIMNYKKVYKTTIIITTKIKYFNPLSQTGCSVLLYATLQTGIYSFLIGRLHEHFPARKT